MKKNILTSVTMLGIVLSMLGIASVSSASVSTVSAGSNQSITLPTSSVNLSGSATASSGSLISGYSWAQTSGPVASTIATPTLASTSVSGLTTAGNYVFTLTASDNTTPTALTNSSSVTVTVNPAVSVSVSAGSNQSITSPTSSVNLSGSASATSPASIASYAWSQVSGPVTATIVSPALASTSVTGLTATGNYVFKLTATDNSSPANTGSSTVTISVNSATPLPPIKAIKSRLEINPNGKVNLQGELLSIGTGTLSVKVWGITFAVNTSSAQWNGKITSADYKVGDMISVTGKIDASATSPTIIARNVKDMTAQAIKERDEKAKKNFGQMIKAKIMEDHGNKGKGNDDR